MQDDFDLSFYDYSLPKKNIAQQPADSRDNSKLFVLHRQTDTREHKRFVDIVDYFASGDVLVINDTKVFPARLLGKKETGGKIEIFLLEYPRQSKKSTGDTGDVPEVTALLKSSKRPAVGSSIVIADELMFSVVKHLDGGKALLRLHHPAGQSLDEIIQRHGIVPLPPYIERRQGEAPEDRNRYQTVYATHTGAVAAPTAGLHFTDAILSRLQKEKNVSIVTVTLHVGYGTFAPVRENNILHHKIHREYYSLSDHTAEQINSAKKAGRRIWAVGTTSVRVLESCSDNSRILTGSQGWCELYITPGFTFRVVDNLITNFHLPQSSLLFLVSALCGRQRLLDCYEAAISSGYRFYSYGDAMAILK